MFKRPMKFLGFATESARCLLLDTQSETTYNQKLFKKAVIGKTYYFSDNNELIEIPDDKVEEAIELYKKEVADWNEYQKLEYERIELEYERIKAENIATGKFIYSYSPYRDGVAETITEILSEDIDKFPQAMVDCLRKKVEDKVLSISHYRKVDLELIKKNESYTKLLNLAEEGDKLVWISWDGGFLAYNAGFGLMRDDKVKYYNSQVVS